MRLLKYDFKISVAKEVDPKNLYYKYDIAMIRFRKPFKKTTPICLIKVPSGKFETLNDKLLTFGGIMK